ncbi:hypothetical protein KI387_011055 [Taxus chinensis]|uniref:BRCT domain-containing protein n=1 Tax=Taxus chinensis TaxID=29808 RepID=A0AA38KKH1_TAXCH|nr:hypothetical protein KI387_011055 [Taxus chinensis]
MEPKRKIEGLTHTYNEDTVECSSEGQEKPFHGVRFFLVGFDPSAEIQYSTELENGGGFNVAQYDARCTHVIVHRLTYDDPICLTARKDKKILVTDWWVADSFDLGMPADPTRIMYRPVKDFGGIPGSKSLCLCLTGYQSQDRSDIMRMVDMMGARFTKPLIAKEVTHLICYKFEGDKYKLAKQMGIKLVNHRWLEDCLKAWALLPEDDYLRSGWELELLEAQAGDSEDDGVGKIGSPTPSRQTIKPGSLFRSPRKSLGTSSSTLLQVNNNKTNTPKSLPKVFSEANIGGERHINLELAGVQSRGTPSSTKCDLVTFLTKKDEVNGDLNGKTNGLCFKEVAHIDLEEPNREEGTGINLSAGRKRRDYIGDMALAEEKIPTSVTRASDVAYSRETPRQDGASDVMRTDRIEILVGSAHGRNLPGEMGKDDVKNIPFAVANELSARVVQNHSGYADKIVHPRDGEGAETNGIRNLLADAPQVKQHIDPGRIVNVNEQFKTPLEMTKTQICQDGVSVGSDLMFQKVRTANVRVDLSNTPSNSDEVSGTGKTIRPAEEISKQTFISSNSNIHLANDKVSNLRIGNPVDSMDSNGEKVYDVVTANVLSSGIVTPNADCQQEPSVGGKRQRQSKGFVSKKKKNTVSGGRLMSLGTAIPLKSGEAGKEEEMHTMELSAEKENIDDGMTQSKIGDKALKMPSQLHALENLHSKTPNSSTLQSIPTDDNSVLPKTRGRKQGINRKAVTDKTPGPDVENRTWKRRTGLIDLNMRNGKGTSCDPQEELLADEEQGGPPNLICDAAPLKSDAAPLRSDALDDCQEQVDNEGSATAMQFISKQEIVSSETLVQNPLALTTNEKPRKRGRPSSKKGKSSKVVDKLNTVIKDAEHSDKDKAPTNQVSGVDNCMALVSGVTISQDGSPNQVCKYDILSTPRAAKLEAPGSNERICFKNGLENLPYASNAQQSDGNKTMPQHSSNLYPDNMETFEVEHSLQVSGYCVRKQLVEAKDAEHRDLETPQNNVGETLQTNQSNNNKKNGANRKSGASKQKKSRSDANITHTNESKSLHADEKSLEPMYDKKQKVSNVNRAPKVKLGNLAKTQRPTKTAKRSRQEYENSAVKKVQDVTEAAKQENSIIVSRTDPRWFLLSGHRLQRKAFQQLIKGLGGKLLRDSHNWSYQATHLVVPEPLRRTEKFFAAVAAGRWVLTTDYLTESKQAGRFLDEREYEWHRSGLNEDGTISYEAPRKWRLFHENTGHGALHGFRIIVYGECIAPTLDTLKRVVKAGGGFILATSPPYNRSLAAGVDFAVISQGISRDDIWIEEFLHHNVACVLVDYLVEFVCKPSYPLHKHVLFNTHAAVEKFLKNREMNVQSAPSNSMPQLIPGMDSRANTKDEEEENKEDHVREISCSVCGSVDRDDVMLLCGDEHGRGCGIAMHIDCCQPPLEEVPEEDWFCFKCQSLADVNNSLSARKVNKS